MRLRDCDDEVSAFVVLVGTRLVLALCFDDGGGGFRTSSSRSRVEEGFGPYIPTKENRGLGLVKAPLSIEEKLPGAGEIVPVARRLQLP